LKKTLPNLVLLICLFFSFFSTSLAADSPYVIRTPDAILKGIPFQVTIDDLPDTAAVTLSGQYLRIGESDGISVTTSGSVTIDDITMTRSGRNDITLSVNGQQYTQTVLVLPGILSLIPPLLAIVIALVTKQIVVSLFIGVWIGVIFIQDYSVLGALLSLFDTYVVEAVMDSSHASIIVFTMAFGGMVGVVAKNGGMKGVVDKISKYASTNRSGQISTMMMGLLIFFDDYANTLLVGNTMRSLTDKLRISREKLSYIVDSTAAPITSMAIISTWVGLVWPPEPITLTTSGHKFLMPC